MRTVVPFPNRNALGAPSGSTSMNPLTIVSKWNLATIRRNTPDLEPVYREAVEAWAAQQDWTSPSSQAVRLRTKLQSEFGTWIDTLTDPRVTSTDQGPQRDPAPPSPEREPDPPATGGAMVPSMTDFEQELTKDLDEVRLARKVHMAAAIASTVLIAIMVVIILVRR